MPVGMPDISQVPRRLGALVTRLGNTRRKPRSRAPERRRQPPTPSRRQPPDVDLTEEWIRLGVHVERLAPVDVSLEALCRVEDAAAERLYQGSRRGRFAG
jgi:hypothetical protein